MQRGGALPGIFRGIWPPARRRFPERAPHPRMPGARPAAKQERGLNENYGREVMELHTVGVDAGYTQQDVIEMAVPHRLDHPRTAQGSRILFHERFMPRARRS